jgi:hypothetical protein
MTAIVASIIAIGLFIVTAIFGTSGNNAFLEMLFEVNERLPEERHFVPIVRSPQHGQVVKTHKELISGERDQKKILSKP